MYYGAGYDVHMHFPTGFNGNDDVEVSDDVVVVAATAAAAEDDDVRH
jgi:hypothetical protein